MTAKATLRIGRSFICHLVSFKKLYLPSFFCKGLRPTQSEHWLEITCRWQESVGLAAELILESRESLLLLIRDNSCLRTLTAPAAPAASAATVVATLSGARPFNMPAAACARPQDSSSNRAGVHQCTQVVPGQSDIILCGVVAALKFTTPENQLPASAWPQQDAAAAAQTVTMHCLLADSAADLRAGRTIQLFLRISSANRVSCRSLAQHP